MSFKMSLVCSPPFCRIKRLRRKREVHGIMMTPPSLVLPLDEDTRESIDGIKLQYVRGNMQANIEILQKR